MEPMQIVLVVLALVGVWAVAELALTLRRTRDVVASLDKTVEQVNKCRRIVWNTEHDYIP